MNSTPSPSRSLPRSRRRLPPPKGGYFFDSKRPLQILLFLLPFVIAYEIGSVLFLSGDSGEIVRTVAAQRLMAQAFEMFGPLGVHLPGITMIVVLFVWHIMARDRWRVHWPVLLIMLLESAVWTFPLLVLVSLIDPTSFVSASGGDPQDWSAGARLTISVGAGLFEELLFRMVAIAAVHFVMVDLFRTSQRVGSVVAVLVAALAFGLYHTGTSNVHVGWLMFYSAAGVYFGALFMTRGFGIVVATHALYDIIALVIISPE